MDSPARSSDGIPFPRFRTVISLAALALGAWIAWDTAQRLRARQALMDPTAPKLERIQAVDRWAKLGREAVPELLEALKSDDAKTRELALLALAQIGRDARGAGSEVARLLGDPVETVRGAALHALRRMGYPLEQELPVIVTLLSAEDPSLREQAAEVLETIGAPAIPLLCDVIDSSKLETRTHAVTLIGHLGEGDPQAIAAVHRAAADPDDQVRGLAYRILIYWNELTLDEAITGLSDAHPQITALVAAHVEQLGPGAEVLLPELIRMLKHDHLRRSALLGLWAMGPAAKVAIPHVLRVLDSERFPELELDVLGSIGAGEAGLVPHVTPFLVDRSPYSEASVRAAAALVRISPEGARAAVSGLVQQMSGEDQTRRRLAAAALSGIGWEAREAVPALTAALADPDEWVRLYAAHALAEIGGPAQSSVDALLALAKDRSLSKRDEKGYGTVNGRVRETAIRALGLIGAEREGLTAVLVDALSDEDESIRAEAALALGRLRADPQTVVPALESVLLGDSDIARRAAAVALGEYGREARSAVPILVGMAEDSEELSPKRLSSAPSGDPFPVESRWVKEQSRYYSNRYYFPLSPLRARSIKSIAIDALRRIHPEALEQAGIAAEATASH